jgi:hypothetical protein
MDIETFSDLICKKILIGDNFANPGGAKKGYGYRTVRTINRNQIVFFNAGTEKEAPITLLIQKFYDVIFEFQSDCCDTFQLKKFSPEVFDSQARPAGHSCNCTFLMSISDKLGFLASGQGNEQIHKETRRPYWNNKGILKNRSFYVKFKSLEEIEMEN